MDTVVDSIKKRVEEQRGDIINFLREIVAIPSMDGQLKEVGERIRAEMKRLKFDEARFDKMGNIMGRIGNGKRVLLYDSHIDTVGIGDRNDWKWDPFKGKVEDGKLYARGTCDEKGSTPGMVYGLALARDLGLLDGFTAFYFGNMEEWCDGIAPNSFVRLSRTQRTARTEDRGRWEICSRSASPPRGQSRLQDGQHHPGNPRTRSPIGPASRASFSRQTNHRRNGCRGADRLAQRRAG